MIQRPCRRVYLRRESSNRIKHATVQRQYLNQVQAKSNRASAERSGGDHLSHLESCCYFHLQGQFSPAAEVVFEATTAIEIKGVAMGSRVGGRRGKRGWIRYIRLPGNKIVELFPCTPFQLWVARWKALLPDSKKTVDSIMTWGLSVRGLHVLTVSMFILFWYSGCLPQSKDMHFWLINHPQLFASKDGCLQWWW